MSDASASTTFEDRLDALAGALLTVRDSPGQSIATIETAAHFHELTLHLRELAKETAVGMIDSNVHSITLKPAQEKEALENVRRTGSAVLKRRTAPLAQLLTMRPEEMDLAYTPAFAPVRDLPNRHELGEQIYNLCHALESVDRHTPPRQDQGRH